MTRPRHSELATLGTMLPLLVAGEIMRGIADSAEAAGCTDVSIGGDLRILGVLPEPGAGRPVSHHIVIGPGRGNSMRSWRCSCLESAHDDLSATVLAISGSLEHVPDGERWTIAPSMEIW